MTSKLTPNNEQTRLPILQTHPRRFKKLVFDWKSKRNEDQNDCL